MLRRLMIAGSGSSGGDPYWDDVVLLLNMGGASGSNSFQDSTGNAAFSVSGDVKIDTSKGYNAARFDGSGDRLSATYSQSLYDWWTGDYTIDAWVYADSYNSWQYVDGSTRPVMIGCASPNSFTNYWSFGPTASGLRMYYFSGSAQVVTGASVPTGELVHIALVKDSTGIKLAVNGVMSSSTAISGTPSSSTSGVSLVIGQIANTSMDGFVKAIRITRAARWANSFTPPVAPFPTS